MKEERDVHSSIVVSSTKDLAGDVCKCIYLICVTCSGAIVGTETEKRCGRIGVTNENTTASLIAAAIR